MEALGSLLGELVKRSWFVDGVGILLLLIFAWLVVNKILHTTGIHFHAFIHYIGKEFIDLAKLKPSIGAVNLGGLALVALVVALFVAALEFHKVILFLGAIFGGHEKAEYYKSSVSLEVSVVCFILAFIVSVLAVHAVEKGKSKVNRKANGQ